MRRITLALVLLVSSGWTTPSQAQWWGGWGGGRPAGSCGPWACPDGGWARPGRAVLLVPVQRPWPGPGGFGPRRFAGPGWGTGWGPGRGWRGWAWRGWAWQREMRLRRIENWHRWIEAGREAGRPARIEGPAPGFRAWGRPARPAPEASAAAAMHGEPRAPAEAAVAMMPAIPMAPPRAARPAVRAVPSRILAAAAMIRHPAAPAPRPAPVTAPQRPGVRPVVLRSRPEPAPTLPAAPAVPSARAGPTATPAALAAPPAAPPSASAAPAEPASAADVPVAPLD